MERILPLYPNLIRSPVLLQVLCGKRDSFGISEGPMAFASTVEIHTTLVMLLSVLKDLRLRFMLWQ